MSRSQYSRRVSGVILVLTLSWGGALLADDARKAPDFSWEDVNPKSPSFGEALSLDQLYDDEGVVLNFIASWCSPCWRELPSFQKFSKESSTPVVLIAADEHGPSDDLLARAEMLSIELPILLVPQKQIGWMEERYDHSMLPSTYMIDFQGQVRQVFQGMISEESLYRAASRHYPDSGIKAPPREVRGTSRQ